MYSQRSPWLALVTHYEGIIRDRPMVLKLLTVFVALACCGLLWVAGELHRENCERAGKVNCSVLPWDTASNPPNRSGIGP